MADEFKTDDNVIRGVPFGDKPGKCPNCGSWKRVPIRYGYPSNAMMEDARRDAIVLGGCIVTEHDPMWQCTDCRHWW